MTPRNPYRHSHNIWWAQLLFMFAASALLIGVLGLGLVWFLSLGTYIETVIP